VSRATHTRRASRQAPPRRRSFDATTSVARRLPPRLASGAPNGDRHQVAVNPAALPAPPDYAGRSLTNLLPAVAAHLGVPGCDEDRLGLADAGRYVVFMVDGEIGEVGTPEQFFTNPVNPRARQFMKSILHH